MSLFVPSARQIRPHAVVAVALLAASLGACSMRGGGGSDVTGSINRNVQQMTEAEKRVAVDQVGRQFDRKPGDKATALTYGRLLREVGQHNQAIAVLQATAVRFTTDREVAAALGQALADGGRFQEAQEVLTRAHTPERPNWRVLSTQGAVADQLGQHATAQQYYQAALQIAPNEPSVLSNLGLSYALGNRLSEAEQTLSRAVSLPGANPRVRGNLALVLALQGKFQESERAASQDMSPQDAAANIAYVRSMTAQNNSWKQLQNAERKLTTGATARR
ncbi:MAG: tetratricopeptide repeat protein [Beijerinckiaceae bacterium]